MPHYAVDATNSEIISEEFTNDLSCLNEIVRGSGEMLEGNLFYFHNSSQIEDKPDPRRSHKRRNLFRCLHGKNSILEVGFNAGHSALLMLSAFPLLHYTAVDIGSHRYTRPCAEYLKDRFSGRFEIHFGDSRDVLPKLRMEKKRYDLIHVDGGHGPNTCASDLSNACLLTPRMPSGHILLDDAKAPEIQPVYLSLIGQGFLSTESLGGLWESNENLLFRVNRA